LTSEAEDEDEEELDEEPTSSACYYPHNYSSDFFPGSYNIFFVDF
jgi:hypothetical protein